MDSSSSSSSDLTSTCSGGFSDNEAIVFCVATATAAAATWAMPSEANAGRRGCSMPGRPKRNVLRNCYDGVERIDKDYFARFPQHAGQQPVLTDSPNQRRYRVSKVIYEKVRLCLLQDWNES